MAVVRKKQDDKYLKALRELVTTGGGNRQCFDCGQKGPTYVNMTIGSFVCTRCSGVLRGLTPPHRVKSISMATFTQEEIEFLKTHGNDLCAKTWLGLWDPKRAVHQDHRELMIDKYERKRYYLEPASPLKSLTNAANLKSSNSTAATSAIQNHNGSTQSSNSTPLTNGFGGHSHKQNSMDNNNSFQNIQLTPPTSQRTTANGLHKSSSSAISRPQHQQQNGFNHHQQQQQSQQDAFMLNHGLNGLNASVGSAASTGALSDTSSCASNGFGPDADFVADFGSANIFDATSAGSVGSPAVSSASSVASSNGYAKIQPIRAAHQAQQQQQQQHQFMNGHANSSKLQQQQLNGTSSLTSNGNGNNTENFADFDHAPIFNAKGLPIPNGINSRSSTGSASANAYSNNNLSSTPAEDRYAALKDLDEQLRESKAVAAAAATIVAATVVDSFGNNNNNSSINPFKSQQQQQQQQQQLHQQPQAVLVNPFQAQQQQQHNNNTQNLNFGGQQQHQQQQQQMTVIANGIATNGFAVPHQAVPQTQQQQQQQSFFNFNSNGFTAASAGGGGIMYPTAAVPNGCGFGFGTMQQQIAATGGMGGGAFNNPFAATGTLNSNNPFL